MRHPYKQFIWRGLWPTFLRTNLSDRLHITTTGSHWSQDNYRKLLSRAIQLFGKLSFTTLQELNGLRHKVALQVTVCLNQLPVIQTQHIPRIPHALKARLPKELAIPLEEVKMMVGRMLRKTTTNMGNMRGQVLRLLERGDNRNYQEWLPRQLIEWHITQSQMSARWSSFLTLPLEIKRQRANQAREALGKQVIPWNFGLPVSANATVYGQAQTMVGQTRRKKTRKRTQTERSTEGGTAEQLQSNHRPKSTDLTWDEFLHGYALPFSNQRIEPLNQQRAIKWTIGDIPA